MTAPPFILAITSLKGGVGKSTLAVNLAGALASKAKGRTVLIDADADMETSSEWVRRGELPIPVLDDFSQIPDGTRYVVLDTEGRPGVDLITELTRQANIVLLPTAPNRNEASAAIRLWQRLQDDGADMSRVRVVVTKAPPVGGQGAQVRDELREGGLTVCETVVRNYKAHERAQDNATLVLDSGDVKAENAWLDVVSLAMELI